MRFRKTLSFLLLTTAFILPVTAWAQQKPFTQEQVSNIVRDGFGDDSGAKLIEQRGIDFASTDDYLQNLKAAGASDAFLNALRAAVEPGLSPAHADLKVSATTATPEPASAKKPINQVQVFALLVGQVPSHRVSMLVQERGIDFEATDDYLQEVRLAGGDTGLISALKGAKVTKSATADPAAQAQQAELRQHVARGAELARNGQYAQAEQEFRAALLLAPQNADLYASLAYVLVREEKWDDAVSAGRESLRLNSGSYVAHFNVGVALGGKGDLDGEITEYREALRLNPNDADAHVNLGVALSNKGDQDGAIAEYREALRLNPDDDLVHVGLGAALGSKGDADGAIAEYREALRLNPENDRAHASLGIVLRHKGDVDGAITEYRDALRLNPNLPEAHANLGAALGVRPTWME